MLFLFATAMSTQSGVHIVEREALPPLARVEGEEMMMEVAPEEGDYIGRLARLLLPEPRLATYSPYQVTWTSSRRGNHVYTCQKAETEWDRCRGNKLVQIPREWYGSSVAFSHTQPSWNCGHSGNIASCAKFEVKEGSKFWWFCGGSREKARVSNSNLIIARPHINGGNLIEWMGYHCPW